MTHDPSIRNVDVFLLRKPIGRALNFKLNLKVQNMIRNMDVFLLRKPSGGAGGDGAEIQTGQPSQSLPGHGVIK